MIQASHFDISVATSDNLEAVFLILKACRQDLELQQIFQWTDHYPSREILEEDVRNGNLFCFSDNGICYGMISLSNVQEKEYATVSWRSEAIGSLVIHRLAVSPPQQGKGYAGMLMDFAESFAKQKGYSSIRLDAYSTNNRSLNFYEKRGYVKRGEVFFPARPAMFYCYEKELTL